MRAWKPRPARPSVGREKKGEETDMYSATSSGQSSWIQRLVEGLNLKFPTVFVLLLALTAADLLMPDPLPFVDELFFALLTVLFGLWKNRRKAANPRPIKIVS